MKVENGNWKSNYDVVREDVSRNQHAEVMARNLLRMQFPSCEVELVTDDESCWHKGDIRITCPDGSVRYVDVKNDKRWGKTGNLNAEDELWKVDWERTGRPIRDGYMRTAEYDGVVYMDLESKEKSYLFISFKRWREVYNKRGMYKTWKTDSKGRKVMPHRDSNGDAYETTYGYLNPIDKMIEQGVIFGRVWFDDRAERILRVENYRGNRGSYYSKDKTEDRAA